MGLVRKRVNQCGWMQRSDCQHVSEQLWCSALVCYCILSPHHTSHIDTAPVTPCNCCSNCSALRCDCSFHSGIHGASMYSDTWMTTLGLLAVERRTRKGQRRATRPFASDAGWPIKGHSGPAQTGPLAMAHKRRRSVTVYDYRSQVCKNVSELRAEIKFTATVSSHS